MLALCPQTLDMALARVWFDELAVTGSEGLVVKDLDGVYRTGGRGSTWWKYKRRVTAEAIIGGIIGAEIVVDQAYDRGRYRHPVGALRIRADLGPDDVERWRP